MNVKDLVEKLYYDSSIPIFFNIGNKQYNYYEVASNKELLSRNINSIHIKFKISELESEDITLMPKPKDKLDIILPANSHYYMIIITVK